MTMTERATLDLYHWELFVAICRVVETCKPRSKKELWEIIRNERGRVQKLQAFADQIHKSLGIPFDAYIAYSAEFADPDQGGHLVVTALGRQLQHHFERLISTYRVLGMIADQTFARPTVSVGFSTTLGTYLLPLVLRWQREVKKRTINCDLRVIDKDPADWAELLAGERVDFICTPRWRHGLRVETEPVRQLTPVVLFPAHHSGFETLRAVEAGSQPFHRKLLGVHTVFYLSSVLDPSMTVEQWLRFPLARAKRFIELKHHSMIRAWVGQGLGVGISYGLPRYYDEFEPQVRAIDIGAAMPGELHLDLYIPDGHRLSEPAQELKDDLIEFCRNHWSDANPFAPR